MARARNIKPGFFTNDELVELPLSARLLFIGLWTIADREGRMADRPKKIKMEIFPADDVDCDGDLSSLAASGFITRYQSNGINVIEIANFCKHQSPHSTEKDSLLPGANGLYTVNERSHNGGVTGKSRLVALEDLSANVNKQLDNVKPPSNNALIPESFNLIPESLELIPDTPIPSGEAAPAKAKSAAAGSRLPADWKPTPADVEYCKTQRPDLQPSLVATNFYDYWISKAGAGGRKADWSATWRMWVRKESVATAGRSGGAVTDLATAQRAANDEAKRRLGILPATSSERIIDARE